MLRNEARFEFFEALSGEVSGFCMAQMGAGRRSECALQGSEDALGCHQSPRLLRASSDSSIDLGGYRLQRVIFKLSLEMMFLAVGHAGEPVDRAALGEAAGVVGDDLVNAMRPQFGAAFGGVMEVSLLLGIIASWLVTEAAHTAEIGEDDEVFHEVRG